MSDRPMTNEVRSVILKLTTGLLPENLPKEEVAILKNYFGNDWFFRPGYSSKQYKEPTFE